MTADAPIGLAVTSSTGVICVAIGPLGQPEPLAAATLETDRRHAEEISPLILSLVAEAGLTLADVEILVVDRGPGRFTGLRVGLATVKTLSFALDVPVVGLSSLEILAASPAAGGHERFRQDKMVTAVIDARRNEVFQQVFNAGRPASEPMVGLADELASKAAGVVVGDGLDRFPDAYGSSDVVAVASVVVDAATMLAIADAGSAVPGSEIEPLYLRTPDVNPNVKTRPRA